MISALAAVYHVYESVLSKMLVTSVDPYETTTYTKLTKQELRSILKDGESNSNTYHRVERITNHDRIYFYSVYELISLNSQSNKLNVSAGDRHNRTLDK